MRKKSKEPPEPLAKEETTRREIVSLLSRRTCSAKELSSSVRISEKEVYDHIEHIRKSLLRSEQLLAVTPAECRKCGFQFSKRERLKKPGKCPVCRGEAISAPLFSIREQI
jgi:predicted Zn-ribbon and HTH transcriptional regulator